MHPLLRAVCLGLLAALPVACTQKSKTVRIAVSVPLTGDVGTEGQGVRRAVELAVEEANKSGRFPFPLEARAFDDRADPKEAVSAANLVASDPNIVAVIGHYNSGCSIPAAQVYARSGIPMISPASTNPKLTSQQLEESWVLPKTVFRVVPTDDVQGSFAGDFIFDKLNMRKIAVIHDKTPYGQGLAEQFKDRFSGRGGQITSFDGIAMGDRDFKALLTRIKADKPQGVYFGGLYMEAALLMRQAQELGFKTTFFSGDGSKTNELIKVAGKASEGAYLSITGIPVEHLASAKPFLEKYNEKYPGVDVKPFDHFAYEATNIVLDALTKVGPDRAKVLEELRRTRFEGILGVTEFDDKGDTKNKIITMTQVKNGEFAIVN
ncbi:MAG: branched-chain amino acid ABC transporter substrate-binding protein [Elusimicrobia bacterium]|nr:branched-chain amino acid ABC transporter substrate-binding protein [Elusimicrobiota bacterium]